MKSTNTKISMRVSMLSYSFYEHDNRVRRYAEALARQGYQVDVVALRQNNHSRYQSLNGVSIFRIQDRVRDENSKYSYLYRLMKFVVHSALFISKQHLRRRYDLIHVHSVPDFLVFASVFAKMTGAKIILDIHDIMPELYASKFNMSRESAVFKALVLIEKASIAFSDHVIVANHIWEKTLLSRSIKKEKCTTMLNYPDPAIFYKRPRAGTEDKFIILYPGTISWHQGLDIAIEAFAQIHDDVPDAEFHIYGDGPLRGAIKQRIADLNLQDKIYLRGAMPSEQIAQVMANAHLGVVPKRNDLFGGDAFSTKILEFMAMGVPVIVAATRIDRHYFNERIVRYFEPQNAADLAMAIKELIQNKEVGERLAANAATYVSEYFWDTKEKDYLSLVSKLVGQQVA